MSSAVGAVQREEDVGSQKVQREGESGREEERLMVETSLASSLG